MTFCKGLRGIKGLWNELEGTNQRTSLGSLCSRIITGWEGRRKFVTIGVDARALIYQCDILYQELASNGFSCPLSEGPFAIFFAFIYHIFLKCPATFVFVFENPDRPTIKRGWEVRGDQEANMRKAIIMSGYHIHQAPGESDCELANLNTYGLVDIVISNDSYVLLFGAPVTLRIPSFLKNRQMDSFDMFVADDLSLDRQSLVLYAMLVGGDYSDVSICKPGTKVASRLLRSKLARDLSNTYHCSSKGELSHELREWRRRLQYVLRRNPDRILLRRDARRAAQIPVTFPDPQVLDAYINPRVSLPALVPSETWVLHPPAAVSLATTFPDEIIWARELRHIYQSSVPNQEA